MTRPELLGEAKYHQWIKEAKLPDTAERRKIWVAAWNQGAHEQLREQVAELAHRAECLPSSDEVQAILSGILEVIDMMLQIEIADRKYR
jgi:hypothetical protein